MKKKILRIFGVALTLVMVLSLAVALAPVASVNEVSASPGELKWDEITAPKISPDDDDDYVLYPGSDVGAIAIAPDGLTMFAAGGDLTQIFKSTDSGYTWKLLDSFSEKVVDICVSPEYEDDTTLFVATTDYVYRSRDAGDEFAAMADEWSSGETITDMDVVLDEYDDLAIMVGTKTGDYAGDVYVYIGFAWIDQDVGDYDVPAVAFIPEFEADGITAVVSTDNMTKMTTTLGHVEDGGAWGDDIGDATFRDNETDDPGTFESTGACIGFPDDFDIDSTEANIAFVGLTSDSGTQGDVYQVTFLSAASAADDLDMRGTRGNVSTATDITSIAVSGDAEDANIVVGTPFWDASESPYYWLVFYSSDSGETWDSPSKKQPTGGDADGDNLSGADAYTYVLMSPTDEDVVYASTSGDDTSAFSRSEDGCESFNQISLIDYGDPDETGYSVVHMAASPMYAKDDTLFMATKIGDASDPDNIKGLIGGTLGAVWKTTNDGRNWERIWSYANPTVTAGVGRVYYLAGDNTVFVIDRGSSSYDGIIWRSSDGGATFTKKINAEDEINAEKILDSSTIYTGHSDGSFYFTTNSGRKWEEPEDSDMIGAGCIKVIGVKGDTVLVGNNSGKVYISSDDCETFETVGVTNPGDDAGTPPTPHGLVAAPGFDSGYATNHIIYCAVNADDGGIWRTEVDEDDPDSADWERIDEESDGYDTVLPFAAGILPGNIMYSADLADVVLSDDPDTARGGMWRSVNPSEEDVDDVLFIKANRGLPTGAVALLGSFSVMPTTMFCINISAVAGGAITKGDSIKLYPGAAWTIATTASDAYWNQIVAFTDTLCNPVELVQPANGETGAGVILSEWNYQPVVTSQWKAMEDADMYEYQLAVDEEFESKTGQCGFTEGQIKKFSGLTPGATYYWRIRVADEDTTGAPLITPWSEVWSFTTALGAGPARPQLVSPYGGPATGGVDTSLTPAFQWTQVFGGTGYHIQVGTDSTFATTTADKELGIETSWLYDGALDYSTSYFWRVQAIGPTSSPWSDVGSFTTVAEPPPPPEPPPAPPPPPEPTTPAYIWTIIGIGALLVIAVIVLIVRTRRVV